MKQLNLKEPIKVRTKKLWMPIHISDITRMEGDNTNLKLYIIPEHNQADKKRNACRDAKFGKCDSYQKIFKYIIKLTDLIIADCPI